MVCSLAKIAELWPVVHYKGALRGYNKISEHGEVVARKGADKLVGAGWRRGETRLTP